MIVFTFCGDVPCTVFYGFRGLRNSPYIAFSAKITSTLDLSSEFISRAIPQSDDIERGTGMAWQAIFSCMHKRSALMTLWVDWKRMIDFCIKI
jgi:hypothetical protein